MKSIRIGAGSGAATDRVDAAVQLVQNGQVDYVCYDTMSEKTMPWQQLQRAADPSKGYDLLLEERLRAVLLLAAEHGVRLIGNFGGVNTPGAVRTVINTAKSLGLTGLRVGAVYGDDVYSQVKDDWVIAGSDRTLGDVDGEVVSANAYIGASGVVDCLRQGADIVVGGRVGDASLYLAPMMYEFGWAENDWDRLGAGTLLGHVVECGSSSTGGNWSEPGRRQVPDMARMGNPIVDVSEDLSALLTKPRGSGGIVAVDNFRAQLLHEVNDPTAYLTPDVSANYTTASFTQHSPDEVRVNWDGRPRGNAAPSSLKVLVGVNEGYLGEAMILLGGYEVLKKAEIVADMARERIYEVDKIPVKDLRIDFVGVNATLGTAAPPLVAPPAEMWVRIAALTAKQEDAEAVSRLADFLMLTGPLGFGERWKRVRPLVSVQPVMLDREHVTVTTSIETVK